MQISLLCEVSTRDFIVPYRTYSTARALNSIVLLSATKEGSEELFDGRPIILGNDSHPQASHRRGHSCNDVSGFSKVIGWSEE